MTRPKTYGEYANQTSDVHVDKREFERKRSLAASEIADAIALPEEPQL